MKFVSFRKITQGYFYISLIANNESINQSIRKNSKLILTHQAMFTDKKYVEKERKELNIKIDQCHNIEERTFGIGIGVE